MTGPLRAEATAFAYGLRNFELVAQFGHMVRLQLARPAGAAVPKCLAGKMNGNSDSDSADILSRSIPAAVADAISEHESLVASWQRAVICGRPPAENVTADHAHLTCRFGRWYQHHSATGMLEGKLFDDLGRMHRETHEAVRYLSAKAKAGSPLPPDEYDALMDVADKFRKIAIRIQELHGQPEESVAIAEDDSLAELQSRLNMLSELEREWDRAARTGSSMSLILVRPNGLEAIRRTYGQIGVDRVVAGMAARLFSHLRPYDSVFRYGRNEFLVCVPGADRDRAGAVAERLDDLLSDDPVALSEDDQSKVMACFGISVSDPKVPVQEVLDRAVRAAGKTGRSLGERIFLWAPEFES